MTEAYFFDTYAVMEIISGNPNYKRFIDAETILTKLNLFEIFYSILKQKGREKAKAYLDMYEDFSVDFDADIIEIAGVLKKSKPKLSMADCIGYVLAAEAGVRFLTGDREFEDMPNVEFVK